MPLLHPVARFIGAALLSLAAPLACAQAHDRSLYDALADLNVERLPGAQRAEAIVSLYERMVGTADPCAAAKLPFDEDDLFRATALAEGYSFDPGMCTNWDVSMRACSDRAGNPLAHHFLCRCVGLDQPVRRGEPDTGCVADAASRTAAHACIRATVGIVATRDRHRLADPGSGACVRAAR